MPVCLRLTSFSRWTRNSLDKNNVKLVVLPTHILSRSPIWAFMLFHYFINQQKCILPANVFRSETRNPILKVNEPALIPLRHTRTAWVEQSHERIEPTYKMVKDGMIKEQFIRWYIRFTNPRRDIKNC